MALTAGDAENIRDLLDTAGFTVATCGDTTILCREIEYPAGAALIDLEALDTSRLNCLETALSKQPPWSDLPLLFLTSGMAGDPTLHTLLELDPVRNAVVLQKPIPSVQLLTSLTIALRGRRRQYVIRDQLKAHDEQERELRENLARLTRILRVANIGTWQLDLRRDMVIASEGTELLYGLAPAKTRPLDDYFRRIHPHDRAHLNDVMRRLRAGEIRDFAVEYRSVLADGDVRWIASRGELLTDPHGHPLVVAGAQVDITESKGLALAVERQAHDLKERMKELKCLYSMSTLVENRQNGIDKLIQSVVDIIPAGFHFPEFTTARVRYQDQDFVTPNFREGVHQLSASIQAKGGEVGMLHVFVVDPSVTPPFLDEEHDLIKGIAERLSVAIEWRMTEEALRQSENRWRTVISALSEGVVVQDWDGMITVCNPNAERILGMSAEMLKASTGRRLFVDTIQWDGTPFPLDDLPMSVTARTGKHLSNVIIGINKPNGLAWLSVNTRPLAWNEEGNRYAVVTSFQDVTERKRVNDALLAEVAAKEVERSRLLAVLDALPVGVFIADATGALVDANAVAAALWANPHLSQHPHEYGKDFKGWWVSTGKRIEAHEWAMARALEKGEVSEAEEIEIEAMDGTRHTILNYALPIRDNIGTVVGAVAVNVDITERKRNEDEVRLLADIVASSSDGIIGLDIDGHITQWNIGAERLYGYTREEVLGKPFSLFVSLDREKELFENIGIVRQGEQIEPYEAVCTCKNGRQAYVSLTLSRIQNAKGSPVGISVIARDITERKRSEEATGRLAAIVEASSDAISSKSLNGIITSWNKGAENIYGYTAEEVIGSPMSIIIPYERTEEEDIILEKIRHGEYVTHFDTVRQRKDGERIHVSITVSPILDAQGNVIGASTVARDITERKIIEAKLEFEAFHDRLTGLPNRALFVDRLAHIVIRARRFSENYAVFVLDIDNFKVINDSLGHLVGDSLLIAFARRIDETLRPVDTMARFGGDEFTILLEEVEDRGTVEGVALRIQAVLEEPFFIDDDEIHVSSSIGITLGNQNYRDPNEALRDADIALYEAKRRGKAQHVIFDMHMRAQAISRLQLETELRRAIARHELILHYQPIVDLESGRVVGCEALARWFHATLGPLEPTKFIPVAEETGLIIPLGKLVLEKACNAAAVWLRDPRVDRDFYVSVNLSLKQFVHGDLVDMVSRILSETGLPGNNLRLEITETVLIKHDRVAAGILHGLRNLGVHVCMDDFGTGYSSLSYLHQFPVDVLKVDRSFIQTLTDEDETSREIVKTILGLANTLDLQSVAEGAETDGQLEAVRSMGFRWAQGFVLSRPIERESMTELLTGVRH